MMGEKEEREKYLLILFLLMNPTTFCFACYYINAKKNFLNKPIPFQSNAVCFLPV